MPADAPSADPEFDPIWGKLALQLFPEATEMALRAHSSFGLLFLHICFMSREANYPDGLLESRVCVVAVVVVPARPPL